jgi:hypothetical protein
VTGTPMLSRKKVLVAAGGLSALVASVGVAHMPFARGLLMRWGGCPFGSAPLAEIEPARRAAIATERGTTPAPARPALGFALDRTTRQDAQAWADQQHVACHDVREGLVQCKDVPASALGLPEVDGPVGELSLGFDTRGRLVDVSTMRMHVARLDGVRDIEGRLEAQVGAPQQTSGSFDEAHLGLQGADGLSSARYRYRDYFAEVIAMRFTSDGLVLREHYMSAND